MPMDISDTPIQINHRTYRGLRDSSDHQEYRLKGFDELDYVPNPEAWPYRANVKIITKQGNNLGECSGTLILDRYVITAAHCLYEGGKINDILAVFPGYNDGEISPIYGGASAVDFFMSSRWIENEEYEHDYAICLLDRPLGVIAGSYTFNFNNDDRHFTNASFNNFGYPGEDPYDGKDMYARFGKFDVLQGKDLVYHNEYSYGGQSGSSAYIKAGEERIVQTILSHGTEDHTGYVRITNEKSQLMANFINQTTPSNIDLTPVSIEIRNPEISKGQKIDTLEFYAYNAGKTDFSGNLKYSIYLSTDDVITTSDISLGSSTFSNINIDSREKRGLRVRNIPLPTSLKVQEYYVGIILELQDEDNENNGTSVWDVALIEVTEENGGFTIIGPRSMNFTPQGGNQNISIETSSSWSVTSNSSWLSFNKTTGTGNGTVGVTCASNTSTQSRSAAITVNVSGQSPVTIAVTQEATVVIPKTLTLSSSSFSFESNSSTQSLTISSNTTWSVAESLSWLSVSPTSGSNNGTVSIACVANTSSSVRTGTITVSGSGVTSQTITITQAAGIPAFSVSPTTLTFSASGGIQTFSIRSNLNWTVSESLDWLSVNLSSGSNDGQVSMTCIGNTQTATRTGTIFVTGGNISHTISVSQMGVAAVISVSPTTLDFTANGGSQSFNITANTNWTTSESLDWLSLSPASGSNNATVTATCLPNTSTTSRTGTIAISGTDQTVTISQTGVAPSLSVAPSQLNFTDLADTKNISISSNTGWTTSDDADWLSITPSSGNGNGTLSVSVNANAGASERRAQITVRSSTGSLLQNISVIQAAKPFNAALPESWEVTITENNHTLILPSSLQADIEGSSLQIGDHIGVFYARDGKSFCAGEGEWNGSNTSFPVYGDDASTTVKDGLSTGEAFVVKVWQAATQQEFNAQAEYAPLGTNGIISATDRYTTDAISMITRLRAARTETLNIALKEGWNTISSYVIPSFSSLDSVFKPIKGIVQIAKDGAGKTYINNPPINSIGSWKIIEGYRIKVSSNSTLPMIGKAVDPAQSPISIRSGWQIIPFFGRSVKTIDQSFASIKDKIEILKDNAGKVYIPDLSINTIGPLQATQGYRLKAKSAGELRYPSDFVNFTTNDPWAKSLAIETDTLQHFRLSADFNTGSNATLVVLNTAAAGLVQAGDEIGVFAADSILCGAGKYTGENLALTVWGDDATETGRQGLFSGEPYQLRIWNKTLNRESKVEADFGGNKGLYQEDDVVLIQTLKLKVTSPVTEVFPSNSIVLFPNPSTGSVNVITRFPIAGPVRIRVLNTNGQVLVQKNHPQGLPKGMLEQFDLTQYPSGVYQIQVLSEKGWWNGKLSVVR
ncbi:BACON domain-containing protein [Haliscomenobacter hydrossis]|nr:BACON domain-containing carbohydrate-binding protein [Haliscomenobacter hydrossis]